jgi:DNA-binding response OmpR family regulator
MKEKETTQGPHTAIVTVESTADDIPLASCLQREGFQVTTAIDGQEVLQLAGSYWQPDIVLLDLTPSEVNVFSVCERVRDTNRTAVIFVLGRDSEEDEIRSLEAGADDYLAKPFSLKVLLARIRAHLRRAHATGNQRILEFGDLRLDTKNYATWVKGEWVALRPQQFRLLVALARSLGVPVSRQELARRSGTRWQGVSSRTVDVNVSRIRACVETPSEYTYIHSIRGVGYRFEPVAKETSSQASPREQSA